MKLQKYTCFCVFANILTQKPFTVKCVTCEKIYLAQMSARKKILEEMIL
jgi:hypothetical protein